MSKCQAIACENGEVWTECCNGSGGCACEGKQVFFGKCRVCDGAGTLAGAIDIDTRSNLRAIQFAAEVGGGYLGNPHGRLRF